jgi:hypothetical protein
MTPIDALAAAGTFHSLFSDHPGRVPFSCTSIAGGAPSFFDPGARDRNAHATLLMASFQPVAAQAVLDGVARCAERFGTEPWRVDLDLSLQTDRAQQTTLWVAGVTVWGANGKALATRNARHTTPGGAMLSLLETMCNAQTAS